MELMHDFVTGGALSGLDRVKWLGSDSGSTQGTVKPSLGFEFQTESLKDYYG